MREGLELNEDFTAEQYRQQEALLPSIAAPSGTAVTDINGLSGPSVILSGGSTGYSFSTAAPNITMTVTPAAARGALLIKAQRVTTGSIPLSSSADVTLTWTAPFADANYTPVASVLEAGANLEIVGIKSYTATQVVVRVRNTDAGGAHTGTLLLMGIHD